MVWLLPVSAGNKAVRQKEGRLAGRKGKGVGGAVGREVPLSKRTFAMTRIFVCDPIVDVCDFML